MTTLRFLIPLLITTLTIQCYSQVDFGIRKQKLKPIFIDTTKENIFVYEVPNAILYFKQDDIKNFIDKPDNKNILTNYGHKEFSDTLTHETQKIKITDYYFYYDQVRRDSIFKQQAENPVTKKLSEEFYFIGAGLILKGQFMVYSKLDKKIITKKLVAKREKGYLGQETLEFYLPDKKQFYYIVTALGD
jgi:hypothetical protein